ncbi:MAG: hypothetical protein H6564_15690 [Lewinellaceae bacterium]|nr:hypothetical protein [Lewinellaceae bacterium]
MKLAGNKASKVSKILIGLTGIALILLFAHITSATVAGKSAAPLLQLSRIDFKTPVDTLTANRIKNTAAQLKGVQHVYFNIPDGILVYAHYPEVQPAAHVFDVLRTAYGLPAERFVADQAMVASSCPVTGKNAPLAWLVKGIRQLFK